MNVAQLPLCLVEVMLTRGSPEPVRGKVDGKARPKGNECACGPYIRDFKKFWFCQKITLTGSGPGKNMERLWFVDQSIGDADRIQCSLNFVFVLLDGKGSCDPKV
jgi:hypothetical protein